MPDYKGLFRRINARLSPHNFHLLRELQECRSTEARFCCHLTFAHRCLSHGITPKGLRLVVPLCGPRAKNTIRICEKRLTRIWISQCHQRLTCLHNRIDRCICSLRELIPSDELELLLEVLEHRFQKSKKATTDNQISKFSRLLSVTNPVRTPRKPGIFVTNVSSYIPTQDELMILDKGLKFVPSNVSRLPLTELCMNVERTIERHMPQHSRENKRQDVLNIVSRPLSIRPNLSKEENAALQSLSRNQDIMILPADKGRSTVIMDKFDYQDKIDTLIFDTDVYTALKKDPLNSIEEKVNSIVRKWKKENLISKEAYHLLKASGSRLPRFFGLPKVHKIGVPLRPVISFIDSPSYALAGMLLRIIRPLVGKNGFSIPNSSSFINDIMKFVFPANAIMVSFDVVSLFTSIPPEMAIATVTKLLQEDKSLENRTKIPLPDLIKALEVCLNSSSFTINGKYFQQKFGLPMGSPISAALSNMVMECLENSVISNSPFPILFWRRFVDDIFAVVFPEHVSDLLNHLNSFSKHLQFTVEKEEDNCLPFLDVHLKRLPSGHVETKVYRKPCCKGQYTNFHSMSSYQSKVSVIRVLVDRAFSHCNNEHLVKEELRRITADLLKCNYPLHLIRRFIRIRTKRKETPTIQPRREIPRLKVAIPYVPNKAEAISRMLRKDDIFCYFTPQNSLRNILVKNKTPLPKLKSKGAIYRLNCITCNATYIGESGRRLEERIKEHERATRLMNINYSAVAKHSCEESHDIDFLNPEILAKETNWFKRKWKEAVFIGLQRPLMNKDIGQKLPNRFHQFVKNIYRENERNRST